jgi:hypothetical protein
MTLEQALLIAISALVAALTWAVKQLWASARKCESDRAELNKRVSVLEREHGLAQGKLAAFESCPTDRCLLKSPARATSRIVPRTA